MIFLGGCKSPIREVSGNNGNALILKVGTKEYKILRIEPNRDVGFYMLVPKDSSVELLTETVATTDDNTHSVIKIN